MAAQQQRCVAKEAAAWARERQAEADSELLKRMVRHLMGRLQADWRRELIGELEAAEARDVERAIEMEMFRQRFDAETARKLHRGERGRRQGL